MTSELFEPANQGRGGSLIDTLVADVYGHGTHNARPGNGVSTTEVSGPRCRRRPLKMWPSRSSLTHNLRDTDRKMPLASIKASNCLPFSFLGL